MKTLILFVIVSHVMSEDLPPDELPRKPDTCHASPEFLYKQCCIFPPFFNRDIAKSCGAIMELTLVDEKNNVTGMRRRAITGCSHWKCILEKYYLIADTYYVDLDKYYNHLDLWVELNPVFSEAMTNAKYTCKSDYQIFFPLKICEFFNLHGCIRNNVNLNCPAPVPTKECLALMEFYGRCKEFYYRK